MLFSKYSNIRVIIKTERPKQFYYALRAIIKLFCLLIPRSGCPCNY